MCGRQQWENECLEKNKDGINKTELIVGEFSQGDSRVIH